MIPDNILKKLKTVCDDSEMYDLLSSMLMFEDTTRKNKSSYYQQQIENYVKDMPDDKN